MATVTKSYKIVNPGRRRVRRNASPAQLAARAKFTAMVKQRNGRKRLGRAKKGFFSSLGSPSVNKRVRKAAQKSSQARYDYYSKQHSSRVGNPGEILTIGLNPGTVRKRRKLNSMARRKRVRRNPRRVVARRRVKYNPRRRRVAVHHRRRTRRRNPGGYIVRRRTTHRRRNPFFMRRRVVRRHRRRNPDFGGLKTTAITVVGLIGGAMLTKKVTDVIAGMVPSLGSGFLKYITTAAVGSILGYGVGRFAKMPGLGSAITLGGFVLTGLQVAQDYFPSFASLSPIGLRGMGLIGPSSFYVPQVPQGGQFVNAFGNFTTPAAVSAAIPVMKGMKGLGNIVGQPGRTRLTRVV